MAETLTGYAAVLRQAHRNEEATVLEARAQAIRGGQLAPQQIDPTPAPGPADPEQ